MMARIWVLCVVGLLGLLSPYTSYGQCSTDELIPVISFESNYTIITVDGLVNDDLSNANQGLCGVFVRMKHAQVGELELKLKSPFGQEISLIGPQGSFGLTSNTTWAITFLPESIPPSPDVGFSGKWNSDQPWGVFGNYTGTYHPTNSPLETFNTGSANGDWIVTASDGFQFDDGVIEEVILFFCDSEGLLCDPCLADPGEFTESEITVCETNLNQVSFQPSFPNGEPNETYEFYYLVHKSEDILSISKELNVENFSAGEYDICGLSLKKKHEDQIPFYLDFEYSELTTLLDTSVLICGKINPNCVELIVTPELADIVLDTSLCVGQFIVVEGDTLNAQGNYIIEKDRGDSCKQKYIIDLDFVVLEGDLVASSTQLNCTDNTIVIDGTNSKFGENTTITWETPNGHILEYINDTIVRINQPGLYVLHLEQGGCNYSSNINITASDDFPKLEFDVDSIDCQNSTVTINLTSSVDLQSINWSGPDNFSSADEDPIVSEPGMYSVTVISQGGCETSSEVEVFKVASSFDVVLSVDSLDCIKPTAVIADSSTVKLFSYNWTGPNGFVFEGPNPEVNVLGIYKLVAQDSFGCIKEFEVSVGGDLDSFDIQLHLDELKCPGEYIDIAVSYDAIEPLITWSGPGEPYGSDSLISVNNSGNYTVEVSANGCTVQSNFEIKDDFEKLPEAEPFQLDSLSCASPTTRLFANIVKNAGNVLKVQWTGPEGFESNQFNPIVSQIGKYTLVITTINNCTVVYNYDVFISQSFPIVDIDTLPITCTRPEGELQLTLNNYNDSTYVFGPGGYASGGLSHVNLQAGSYTIEVYDSTGCKSEFIVPIAYDTLVPKAEIVPTNLLDCIYPDMKLYASKKYDSYSWSNDAGIISNSDTLLVTSPGVVYLEVGSSNGCVSKDTFLVESSDNNINIVEIPEKIFDCANNRLKLEVVADKTIVLYNWEGPNGFNDDSKNPIITEPGAYQVTVTGSNGCVASGEIMVEIDTVQPTIMTEYDHILTCSVNTATLSGGSTTDDVTYLWTGPSGFSDVMPAVLVDEAGLYTFTVTGKNHCTNTEQLELPFEGIFAEITTTNDTVFCKDNLPNVQVESNLPNVTYEWSGPGSFSSNLNNPTVIQAGTYFVTVTTDQGCETEGSAKVIFKNNLPNLTLEKPVETLNCSKKEVVIDMDVDISTNEIQWTGPDGFESTNLDITVNQGGIYQLVVEGYNNCINTIDVTVEQDTVTPQVELSVDTINCFNPSVKINVSSEQSIASFNWQGPNGFTSSATDQVDVFEKGIYSVLITGTNDCTNTDSIEVFDDLEVPQFDVQIDTLNCEYDMLSLKLVNAESSDTYSWTGPDEFSSTLMNPMTNVAGLYEVTVQADNGCTSTKNLEILDLNYYPEVDCEKSGDITCIIQQVNLKGSEISDGESRSWQGPNAFSSTNEEVVISVSGIYTYYVEGFTGCISEKSIEVVGDTIPPTIILNQIGEVRCEYDSVDINAFGSSEGGEFKYSWFAREGQILEGEYSNNPVITGLGKYILTIVDESNGCIKVDSIDVEEQFSTLESLETEVKNISCHEDSLGSITIKNIEGGFPPFKYAREGYSYDTTGIYDNLEMGSYVLMVKDSFGCLFQDTVVISKDPLFTVDLGQDLKVKLGDIVQIQGSTSLDDSQIDSLRWIPVGMVDCESCLDFEFEPSANTKVILEIVDKNGCKNQDEKIILVDDKVEIYIPNIFSPNGDGTNDFMTVSKSKMVEEILSFRIYDRWGSIMHEEYQFKPGEGRSWDGKHLGEYVVNGVYPYTLQMKLKNGKLKWKKGTITVVK